MSILMQNIRNKANKVATTRWLPEFPERLKGGRIEKWKNYWVGVKRDYIEATEDVIKSSKESPVKTTIILGISGFLGYCAKTNPTLEDYKMNYLDNSLDILQVNDTIRNKKSENLQNYISRAINANLIRRNNYGLFSLIWVDDFSPELAVYAARCEYIKPTFSDLRARLIDVGFLGRWWISSRKMLEFDVNEDEWDSVTGMPVQPTDQLKQMW